MAHEWMPYVWSGVVAVGMLLVLHWLIVECRGSDDHETGDRGGTT